MVDANVNPRLQEAVPVFLVGDIAATMRWYAEALGFEADPFPASAPHAFCILRKDGVTIFLQQLEEYQKPKVYDRREGGVWNAYFHMRGVREFFQRLSQREDVTMLESLVHQPYGQTEFVVRDPNGYVLVFAEAE